MIIDSLTEVVCQVVMNGAASKQGLFVPGASVHGQSQAVAVRAVGRILPRPKKRQEADQDGGCRQHHDYGKAPHCVKVHTKRCTSPDASLPVLVIATYGSICNKNMGSPAASGSEHWQSRCPLECRTAINCPPTSHCKTSVLLPDCGLWHVWRAHVTGEPPSPERAVLMV